MKKKCILILGMHRTGTSALSGIFNILGCYQGENIWPTSKFNPKGYFENKDLVEIEDGILKYNNISWDLEYMENEIHLSFKTLERINEAINIIFGENELISIKSCRGVLFNEFYRFLLEHNYELHIIKTDRQRSEIVQSLMNRDHFTENKCNNIIDIYNEILDGIDGLIIPFNNTVNNLDNVIELLKTNFPFLNYSEENIIKCHDFIDKSLKHY